MTRREAKEIAKEYSNFLHFHPHPSEEAWRSYKSTHPKVLDSVFEEGPEALIELKTPEEHAEHKGKEHEHPQSRVLQQLQEITMAPIGLFRKSQSLEEDSAYNKVQDQLKRNYLKNRNKKRFDYEDTQDLDFLYGSVDDPGAESLETKALKAFQGEDATVQISEKQKAKNLKNLERYDKNKIKIHGSFDKDPYVWQTRSAIAEHGALRHAALKKEYKKVGKKIDEKFNQDFKHTMERLKANSWKKFVEDNPQKAAVYVAKETKKRAPARNATQSVAGGEKAIANAHEDDDFVFLEKAYKNYREQASQGQARPAAPIPKPSAGPVTLPIQNVLPQPLQAKQDGQKTPEEILLEQQLVALKAQRAEKKQDDQASPSQQTTTPRLSQNKPANVQQGLTPQSNPSHPSAPKPPSQGLTRPPMQKVPLPPLTRRYIPSHGRARPGGYSNPIVSLGRNYIQNRLSGMGQRMMGRIGGKIGGKIGQAAGNAGKQLAQKAAARLLMNPVVLFWTGVAILVLIILILLIVLIIYIFTGSATKTTNTIPGLTLSLVGPTQVQNSENIQYTINATYTGTAAITLSDPLPTGTTFVSATGNFTNVNNTVVWKFADNDPPETTVSPSTGTTRSYTFTLVLHPDQEDILVRNKIIATALGGSGGPGGPVLTGGSGNACTAQYEGTGYCSVENLKQYFGGDAGKALVASMICQTESTSNPNSLNNNCKTNDYSVGLFQINLVAHCAGAYGGLSCNNLLDMNKRNVCEAQYKNPEENIRYMVQLSQNGTKWTDWSAYTSPSIGARRRLAECGIN